jgi:hypothetical protein
MIPVISYELVLHPVGAPFMATLDLHLLNIAQVVVLQISSQADFNTLAALLQLPGKLFYLPAPNLQPNFQLVKQG